MTICLFTGNCKRSLVRIHTNLQNAIHKKAFCVHIDIHMNAKWIQTNILFVKHEPEILNRIYLCILSLFLFLNLSICVRVFGCVSLYIKHFVNSACRTRKSEKTGVFFPVGLDFDQFTFTMVYMVFSSVNKICIVIDIWIFKNRKKRHTQRKQSQNQWLPWAMFASLL